MLGNCSDGLLELLRVYSLVVAACRPGAQVVRQFGSRRGLLRLPLRPLSVLTSISTSGCSVSHKCPTQTRPLQTGPSPPGRPDLLLSVLPPFLFPCAACLHATYLNPVPKAELGVISSRKSPLTALPICWPPWYLIAREHQWSFVWGWIPFPTQTGRSSWAGRLPYKGFPSLRYLVLCTH